jgi:Neuraminidase (sialidase)
MKRLTRTVQDSRGPAIAVSGNIIHVVWAKDTPGNIDIYYRRSTDNGVTWGKTKRLTKNEGLSLDVDMAASGSDIHVVWKDNTPGNAEIFYKQSSNNGATWEKTKRLTCTTGHSALPAIAVINNNIYVVWNDDTPGNNEIYFMRSKNNGATWSKIKRLTQTAGSSRIPDAALSGGNIHVVWQDTTIGNPEIYYKRGP